MLCTWLAVFVKSGTAMKTRFSSDHIRFGFGASYESTHKLTVGNPLY